MPRASADKAYTSFQAGFITEATGLSYPEGSLVDALNVDIERSGAVRRRLGLDEEPLGMSFGGSSLVAQTGNVLGGPLSRLPLVGETCDADELAITAHLWPAPGGATTLTFLVVQIGNELYVRNGDTPAVSSLSAIVEHVSGFTSFLMDDPVDGLVYNTSHILAAKQPMQTSPGFGRLWFTSPAYVPFYMEYDPQTKVIVVHPVGFDETKPSTDFGSLTIRDFNGVDDGLETDEQPNTLSTAHRYNLLNQGWPDANITAYEASVGEFPANSQQWILGKDPSDVFSPSLLEKQDFGNSPAPRGRAIMDALGGSRDNIFSGVSFSGAQDEKAESAFSAVAFYAGRVWFTGDSNKKRPNGIYYSKILQKPSDAGTLRQENDPTSEHFSDLLATDGGVIYLTEAANISKLVPLGHGLLIMATNGIWFVSGGDVGFTATQFGVDKVGNTGLLSASSVVASDQYVSYFAENGVNVVAFPDTGVTPAVQDISRDTINTFYGLIPRAARRNAQAVYDSVGKKIHWSWLSLGKEFDSDYSYPHRQSQYNRMLVLDTRTGAFTKYDFTVGLEENFINGPSFPKQSITRPRSIEPVFDSGGEAVVDSTGDPVFTLEDADRTSEFLTSLKVIIWAGEENALRLGEFYSTTFFDYALMNFGQQDYTSTITAAPETLGELQRSKQVTFVHSFFNRTETGVKLKSLSTLVFDNPSGCTAQGQWDWHSTAAGNRWSEPQVVYRYRRPLQPVGPGPIDTGDSIVYTKVKIRGKGRALSMKYTSVPGKDFQLLGMSIPFTAAGV